MLTLPWLLHRRLSNAEATEFEEVARMGGKEPEPREELHEGGTSRVTQVPPTYRVARTKSMNAIWGCLFRAQLLAAGLVCLVPASGHAQSSSSSPPGTDGTPAISTDTAAAPAPGDNVSPSADGATDISEPTPHSSVESPLQPTSPHALDDRIIARPISTPLEYGGPGTAPTVLFTPATALRRWEVRAVTLLRCKRPLHNHPRLRR